MGKKNETPDAKKSSYGSVAVTNYSDEVTETFMPSPHSTNSPSRENLAKGDKDYETYQLLPTEQREGSASRPSEIQLKVLNRKRTFEEVMHDHVTGRHVRTRTICLVIALAVSIGCAVWFSKQGQNTKSSKDGTTSPIDKPFKTNTPRGPFSKLHPVKDLGLYDYTRPKMSSPPSPITEGLKNAKIFPTNAWYQSLLMPADEPEVIHRAYAIPYIVDAAGPVPGMRIHGNHVDASNFVVQLYVIEEYGLTVGAGTDAAASKPSKRSKALSGKYKVTHATPLGVTLEWKSFPMHSSITKGMPYATMRYERIHQVGDSGENILPTVTAEVPLAGNPIIDGGNEIQCHPSSKAKPFVVESEVKLFFKSSDFTWLVFVSEPVVMQCVLDENDMMSLQVVDWNEDSGVERDLVIRIALAVKCTSGVNPIYCHQEKLHPTALMLGQGNYVKQLRKHANFFPGPNTTFDYRFDDAETATMVFDWDVQVMSDIALHPVPANKTDLTLIGFALPHQFDIIAQVPPADHDIYCVATLIGPACLYEGPVWELEEKIPPMGFRAPRPVAPWAIGSIAESLQHDINFTLPHFYRRGIGDTYFSGKQLAKLGRILLIYEEVEELCSNSSDANSDYKKVCQGISLPSQSTFSDAVANMRSSVEVWINGSALTPFVYDSAWGGVVSCGCVFNGDTNKCDNKFPDCTGFGDPGLNFGNAFYNDMHFHYGYFIFSAAVVSHFDPEWGRQMFERVLLLIRCIANPSDEDEFFPTWRHKDWFQGHSWASGIAVVFLNGKNQESSSESIAAYEAIALYGNTMVSAWEKAGAHSEARIAREIEQAGQLLTATELRSARAYWHVSDDEEVKIYPSSYTPKTIGILWQTMAQCQTWFGAAAYLAYGIQLLPLTPISEFRDTLSWSKGMYHIFSESCGSDPGCTTNGWSVLQIALLAVVGYQQDGAEIATALPADVFESAGGNGHSLTNTLWYVSTRPFVDVPLELTKAETKATKQAKSTNKNATQVKNCGKPGICTDYVLDTIAGEYTCRQRMDWLVQQMGQSEKEACIEIAGVENPYECGACNPEGDDGETSNQVAPKCSQCTLEQCQSDLNRCPLYEATFVCTQGGSLGGCSRTPWNVPSQQCEECCELTHCTKVSASEERAHNEDRCPPCSRHECRESMNQCRPSNGVLFLCQKGPSEGGCSLLPWDVGGFQCSKCCSVSRDCGK